MRKGDVVSFTVSKIKAITGEVVFCNRIYFTLDMGSYRESFLFRDYPQLDREKRKERAKNENSKLRSID